MTNARLLSVLVLGLGLAIVPLHARATGSDRAERLSARPGEIRFTVRFDEPQLTETELDDRVYRFPNWPGLVVHGLPGDPDLPGRIERVALPSGATPSLDVDVEAGGRFEAVRFAPHPSWAPVTIRGGRRDEVRPEAVSVEGAAYEKSSATPYAEILSIGNERGVHVATLVVRPVSWNPATGEAEWARSVTVTLGTGGAPARSARLAPAVDRAAKEGWDRTLVNASDASAWQIPDCDTVPQPNAPDGVPSVWFDDAAGWVKVQIKANGVHRITRSALAGVGVDVNALDPRTLRLFAGPLYPEVPWADLGWGPVPAPYGPPMLGTGWIHVYERPEFTAGLAASNSGEIPIVVNGESDGVFDASDAVLFYALGPDNYRDRFGLPLDTGEVFFENPYSNTTVYWLAWGGTFPGSPRRMDQVAAAPVQGAPVVTESLARLHAEQNELEGPSFFDPGYRWEFWFWDDFDSDDATRSKQIALPHVVPGSTFDARVRLWGATVPLAYATGEEALHHVQVVANDAPAPLAVWGGSSPRYALVHKDVELAGAPALNPSTFTFVLPQVGTDPNRRDLVNLAWIDVTYRRVLDADAAAGELPVDAGQGGRTVRIARPPSGALTVMDVTDARNPRLLTGTVSSGSGASATLELSLDREGAGIVAFAPAAAAPAPAAMTLKTAPRLRPSAGEVRWLRDTREPIDYVIITYDAFEDEAEVLAAWRRSHLQGISDTREARVRVVRVSDIMDEFAFGMWDPVALRHFLEYAYRYYGDCGSDDRLSYCLFLGDHTYDFRDILKNGVKDFVPSWEDNRTDISDIGFGNVQYVSDDPLARFHGPLDSITDLYIGRITATTVQEAHNVIVEKVIRSEANPSYGAWRAKTILVADDICQGKKTDGLNFAHMDQTEDLDRAIPDAFDRVKVYLYDYGEQCLYDSKPDAKRALLRAWSDGAWLVNYVGHGADVVLADEHVFDLTDVPALANRDRLPVFGAFSCSVGKFSKITQQGIGEALVLADRAGALVSAAATHLTSAGGNADFNLAFVRGLFAYGGDPTVSAPVGKALMEAKRGAREGAKYVCLGDPASRLTTPERRLDLDGPTQMERGGLVELRVDVEGEALRQGGLDVLAQDARLLKDRNSLGNPIPFPYYLAGATVYRGAVPLAADTALVRFTVPVALRGGPSGKVRVYAEGDGWDGLGTLILPVTAQGSASTDTTGPGIGFPSVSGSLRPSQQVEIVLEDPAGINVTGIFDFLSVVLKVFDDSGLERAREDLTSRFAYDSGSATRGKATFTVPDLEAGDYTFLVSAADNYNNRNQAALEASVGVGGGGSGFRSVAAYPNPFNPEREPTRVLFSLDTAARVTVRVYSVAGRLVRKGEMEASAGGNAFTWNGRDEAGDAVSNGVYLVHLTAKGEGGTHRHLERLAVVR